MSFLKNYLPPISAALISILGALFGANHGAKKAHEYSIRKDEKKRKENESTNLTVLLMNLYALTDTLLFQKKEDGEVTEKDLTELEKLIKTYKLNVSKEKGDHPETLFLKKFSSKNTASCFKYLGNENLPLRTGEINFICQYNPRTYLALLKLLQIKEDILSFSKKLNDHKLEFDEFISSVDEETLSVRENCLKFADSLSELIQLRKHIVKLEERYFYFYELLSPILLYIRGKYYKKYTKKENEKLNIFLNPEYRELLPNKGKMDGLIKGFEDLEKRRREILRNNEC